ncbi:TVP38/TMEM64 family protein [Celerinatantimonas sp. YJH-8]|uniref:TVP38/TMEM64 family protein n=1 Tax=Celerinatantimonas sp. YJH-8 TaxID=3228714 RepID=UPI0038CA2A51
MNWKRGLKSLILVALLGLIFVEMDSPLWHHIADRHWIADYLSQEGWLARGSLLIFGIVFTGIGGPRQLLAALFGFLFGAVGGIAASLCCSLSGATLAYSVSRFVLFNTLQKRFGRKLEKFQRLVEHQPFLKILMIRLLPVGSNIITNLLSGCVAVRFIPFLLGSLLGYLPQTIIFALAGAGVGNASRYQLIVSVALGAISFAVGILLYRSHLQRRVESMIKE